ARLSLRRGGQRRRHRMVDDPTQLPGDITHAVPALIRLLLEAAFQHVIEQRMRRLQRGDRRRLDALDRGNDREGAGALERLASREHLVEYAAERENVRAVIARATVELLWRHV